MHKHCFKKFGTAFKYRLCFPRKTMSSTKDIFPLRSGGTYTLAFALQYANPAATAGAAIASGTVCSDQQLE